MARSLTSRLGLQRWSADTDTQSRADFDNDNAQLESKVAIALTPDVSTARPAAGVRERLFLSIDEGTIYWDSGTGWRETSGPVAWSLVSPGAAFTGSAESRRFGPMVDLRGSISPSSGSFATGTSTVIVPAGGLAADHRPAVTRVVPVAHTFGGGAHPSVARVAIGADGSITLANVEQTSVTTVWLDGVRFSL